MKNIDVLRLQVETPPDDGLINLIQNPSGDLGGWGWVTPVVGSTLQKDGINLRYDVAGGVPNYLYSESYPASPGDWIGASWFVAYTHQMRGRIEYLDASGIYLSSGPQSAVFDETPTRRGLAAEQAPVGAAFARLRFDVYSAGGNPTQGATLFFREAMLATAPTAGQLSEVTRTNYVTNPSFETDTTGWSASAGIIARSTSWSEVGSASLLVTRKGSGDFSVETPVSPALPAAPGATYTVSAATRSADGFSYHLSRIVIKRLSWDGSSSTLIEGPWAGDHSVENHPSLTAFLDWEAGGYTVIVELSQLGSTNQTYVDAVIMERSDTYTGYFDGASADPPGADYGWTGTANNSPSTLTEFAPYRDPIDWTDVLAPTHEIKVTRAALDVGLLTATILNNGLDPADLDLIRPGRKVRLQALESGGSWSNLFYGDVTNARVTYDIHRTDNKQARIFLTAADDIRELANVSQAQGVATISELAYLMEGAGVPWIVNGRSGQSTTATIVSKNENASLLDQIAVTRDSVLGYAWVDRNGVLNAWDAAEMSTSEAVIDEAVYSDMDIDFNTDSCINDVRVKWLRYTPATGETEEIVYGPYRDAGSIAEWGYHSAEFTIHGPVETSIIIDAYAASILAANANPVVRINSVTIPVNDPADVTAGKALLDLYGLVQLIYTMKALNHMSRITGIEHDITPETWLVTVSFEQDGSVATPQVIPSPATGSSDTVGALDHGSLTGLGDDDHPQYHNNARGDARYAPLSHNHSGANITSGTIADARLPTTMAGKTLSGTTTIGGEQIAAMRFGNASGTTNASGQLVVTHGLGVTPTAVLLGAMGFAVRVQGTTSTTFTVECRLPTTSAVAASTAVTFSWMAIA